MKEGKEQGAQRVSKKRKEKKERKEEKKGGRKMAISHEIPFCSTSPTNQKWWLLMVSRLGCYNLIPSNNR